MPVPMSMARVGEIDASGWPGPDRAVLVSAQPLVLRRLAAQWPLVQAAGVSAGAALDYLRGHYRNATVGAWFGPPEIRGRFFYNEDLSGFNYRAKIVGLDAVLDAIARHLDDAAPPALYVGSTTIDTCLPGLRRENDIRGLPADALASIWLGNRTRIAAHYDVPDNIACVGVGRRRFTLFPPAALPDLYIGPLDFTPAGQPISLVDFAQPDLTRFPRFARALDCALVAELGPGDAIFIPSMWWHHVESLETCNVLVNYWWRQVPAFLGSPVNALLAALLGLRSLPPPERAAWQGMLQHYVFEPGDAAVAHIPERCRGILGPMDEARARALRARLLNQLNR